jgi:hypothetical protein
MSKRGISILLLLTAAIAIGALVQDYRFDGWLQTERLAASGLDADIAHVRESIVGLSAVQGAYLADGQGPAQWLTRMASVQSDISTIVTERRSATSDTVAGGHYDAAAAALARFKKLDDQARAAIAQGEKLRAADLIFNDCTLASRKISEELDAAHAIDREAIAAGMTRLARLRLAMNGVALLFALAIGLFFGRHIASLAERSAPTTAQMLKDLPPPVKAATSAAHATPIATSSSGPASSISSVAPVPNHAPAATAAGASKSTNLIAAAELCVDLARVVESSEVPALLERTATLLDARGLVIWAVDADGARLKPALSHGYADKVLQKLRPLQIDGDNVTSLAFRSLEPQSMNGASPNDPAAIAIPLITGTGCVGVMAAELRHNRPHADLLPVARILGAQFSTLIATPDEPVRRTAQA